VTDAADGEPMEATRGDRVGVLVLRVWLEGPRPVDFRARITAVSEIGDPLGEPRIVVVASVDEASDVVRAFVEGFAGPGGGFDGESPGGETVTPP
jgi:hypothetical protein